MITVFEMEYSHPVDEKPCIEMVPYTPVYKEEYKYIYNECFREMRTALDIQPYDFIQDDSYFDSGMDQVYLLTDKDRIIGSVALKGKEIDDLIVNIRYQGQGYGRQILLWALSHIQADRVILHVAKWNQKAIRLYQKTGVEITKRIMP